MEVQEKYKLNCLINENYFKGKDKMEINNESCPTCQLHLEIKEKVKKAPSPSRMIKKNTKKIQLWRKKTNIYP